MINELICSIICAKVIITKHEPIQIRETTRQEEQVHRVDARPSTVQTVQTKRLGSDTKGNGRDTRRHEGGVPQNQVTETITKVFGENAQEAIKVAQCESGLRPNALGTNTNGTQDHGVFQINSVHFGKIKAQNKKEWLMDVENNVKLAKQIYDRQGWSPWVCARKVLAMK